MLIQEEKLTGLFFRLQSNMLLFAVFNASGVKLIFWTIHKRDLQWDSQETHFPADRLTLNNDVERQCATAASCNRNKGTHDSEEDKIIKHYS